MGYRPLPPFLTIQASDIEGLGLFATDDIPQGALLGMTHHESAVNGLMRTPLGGFYNHSDTPNCAKQKFGKNYFLFAVRPIAKGEEITVKYTLYEI